MQLHAQSGHDIIPLPEAQSLDLLHVHDKLARHLRLEVMTRLNPLMNQERMKAMVMTIAANWRSGGAVHFDCCPQIALKNQFETVRNRGGTVYQ